MVNVPSPLLTTRQKAPSAKRCIKTLGCRGLEGVGVCLVRKHRAPKGALRRFNVRPHTVSACEGQKAPSAKRCIKTWGAGTFRRGGSECVRKHRAPKGALGPLAHGVAEIPGERGVRKHRAPKGALRHFRRGRQGLGGYVVRKHRAPKGALRHRSRHWLQTSFHMSESTERQKVH